MNSLGVNPGFTTRVRELGVQSFGFGSRIWGLRFNQRLGYKGLGCRAERSLGVGFDKQVTGSRFLSDPINNKGTLLLRGQGQSPESQRGKGQEEPQSLTMPTLNPKPLNPKP